MGATIDGPAEVYALQENPAGTLIADPTDSSPITFTIVNSGGGPAIPDVIVSGADSGDGTYLDIDTIVGRAAPGDTVAVAIDAATSWVPSGPGAGTVTVQGYSSITFSAIDHLVGAADRDTFVFPAGVAFGGALDGGPGVNALDYSAFAASVAVDLAAHAATGTTSISNIRDLIGGSGADFLTGDSQDNVLTGGPGKDIITGGEGLDTIAETFDASFVLSNKNLIIGADKDTLSDIEAARLTGGPSDNVLSTKQFAGSVVLDGAAGNDTLEAGSGADVLIGGPGDDAMNGGSGNDEYQGGPGSNTITELVGGGTDTVVETCDAGFALTDSGLLTWSEGSESLANIENIRLIGGPADNDFSISALAGGSVSVEGGDGYDTLTLVPVGIDVDLVTGGIVVPGLQLVRYEAVEAVNLDGDAAVSADATLSAREYNLDSLTVTNDSVLTLASDSSAAGFQGVKITTSSDLAVTAGSLVSADGQGYAAGQGLGAGATAGSEDIYGGGGGYGGPGGDGDAAAHGGMTYGSSVEPTDLGSGGGNDGGAGGGAIFLSVDGTLLLGGAITCQGSDGDYHAGGGSGGSIYLEVGTLAGAGTVSVDGGAGGEGGGGGGGGRIAVYYHTDAFSGAMTASGGAGLNPGGAGTIFLSVSPEAHLEAAISEIRQLTADDFTNANSGKALINKLEATTALVEAGLYQDALMKLQHDLLPKVDGCALTGMPDRNDWIVTCAAQQTVYPHVLHAMQRIEDLM